MTFDHPWVLLALLLPLGWAAWEWRGSARRLALGLKAAAFVCIVLALSGPRLMVYQTKVAVAVLADTSASVSPEDLARESAIASEVQRGHGRHWTRIMPFARGTRMPALEEKTKNGWQLRHTAGTAGRGTDLESAIRDGAAALPAGMVPRLLLISDGNENLGSVARAIWQAQQLGIPIDTVALAGRPKPGLRLESVTIPGQVFSGERFPIDVAVEAPRAAHARVEMTAEGKTIGSSHVELARRRESSAAAGQRQLRGRHRAGRQDRGQRPGRGALRGCGYAAQSARAAGVARPGRQRGAHHPRAACQPVRSAAGARRHSAQDRRFPTRRDQQLGHGIDSGRRQGVARRVREEGRRPGVDRRRAQRLRGQEGQAGGPAGAHPARQTGAAALARRHGGGADHRQILLHGRPQDRTGAPGRHRRGGESAAHRFGGRADLRQFVPVGGAHPQGGRSRHHQEADLRHHAGWRHADRAGAHRGLPAHPAADRDVQAHRAAHRRHFRRGRQHDAHQGSAGEPRDHLHGRAGAGCESRVSGEGGGERGRQIVLPERPLRPGTDSAARRGRAHRRHGGGEADHTQGDQAGGDPGRRGDGHRAAVERLRALRVAAHLGHHPDGGPRRSAAGALAVRAGARGGVHLRRQEPLGRQLGAMAGLRQAVGQHLPRPAAARAAERNHGRFRPRERRTGGGLPALAQRGGAGQDAGHFRPGAGRLPRAAEDGQGGGGTLSRAPGDRAESGTLPRAAPGGFARLSRGGLLPPGRRDAGVRQQRAVAAPDRRIHRRALRSEGRRRVRGGGTEHSGAAWNCGRDCWPWRSR